MFRSAFSSSRDLMHVLRGLVCIVVSMLFAQASAQSSSEFTSTVREYGVEDGLISRRVDQVIFDRQGFLWLATPGGVQRFDGYSFQSYTMADGLSTNAISKIWPDADGLLWLVSKSRYSGGRISSIDILDPRTGTTVPYTKYFGENAPAPVEDLADRAILMQDSTLLLSAKGRLIHYHSAEKGCTVVPVETDQLLQPLLVTGSGEVWCTALTARDQFYDVVKLDPEGRMIQLELPPLRLAILNSIERGDLRSRDQPFFFIAEEPEGKPHEYSISPKGELHRFADTLDHEYAFKATGILYMNLGRDLWFVDGSIRQVGTGSSPLTGVEVLDPLHDQLKLRQCIHSATHDGKGNIWLATEFGLWQVTMRHTAFQRWMQYTDSTNGRGHSMRGMTVVHDTLFANIEQHGFWYANTHTGIAASIIDSSKYLCYAMAPNGHDAIWVADHERLFQWRKGKEVASLRTSEIVTCIMPMGDERLLLGTLAGLAWADTGLTKITVCTEQQQGQISFATIQHLFKDKAGQIWVCSSEGLGELNDTGTIDRVWSSRDSTHYLPANNFHHVYEDPQGIFWLSTATNGLLRWDRATGSIRSFSTAEGWPSSAIYAVYPDDRGKYWLPTGNGIVRFDPVSEQVHSYSTVDGISHYEFNRWSHTKGPDGRFYFGSLNGVTVFHPEDLADQQSTEALLVISRLQQFDGNVGRLVDRTAQTLKNNTITVRPEDSYFILNMALLSYEEPSQVLYNWRIDGIHTEWNYQREPELNFASLPYGEQRLRIRAKGGSGEWNRNELVLTINVIRPWYLRWWAIALFVTAIAAGVYLVFRIRLARVRAMMAMRDRIALDLHDEVGSTLSSVALFSTAIRNAQKDRSPEETDMLKRISENSTQAMESMNDIVWSVNTRYDKLADVEDRMNAYAGPLADAQQWQLDIVVEEGIRHMRLTMNERKNLYLIFKEAVNNVVKYAQCDHVEVSLRSVGQGVELKVKDNGIGIQDKNDGTKNLGGNGILGMKLRAEAIDGDLSISREGATGTVIALHFTPKGGY